MKNTPALYVLAGLFVGFALAHIGAAEPGWAALFIPSAAAITISIAWEAS